MAGFCPLAGEKIASSEWRYLHPQQGSFRPRMRKAGKRRQRRKKRAAFEEMAQLAARQGRES